MISIWYGLYENTNIKKANALLQECPLVAKNSSAEFELD